MITKNILKHKHLLIAVSYTIWLTAISLMPTDNNKPLPFDNADKVIHFFLYFFLVIVWLKVFSEFNQQKIVILFLIILWGIMIEIIQDKFIPGRTGDFLDALANSIGGITAFFIFHKFLKK